MKVPWVASAGPAYGDLRPYGWLVENKAAAWERVLLDMVDHIDDYKAQAGRDPYLHALSMGIDDHVDEMVQLFASFGQRATV